MAVLFQTRGIWREGQTIIERFFDLNQAIMLLGLTYLVSAG
jgi:hypothetical protein